jgi:hypothetical protein
MQVKQQRVTELRVIITLLSTCIYEEDLGPQLLSISTFFSNCHSAEDPRPKLQEIITLLSTCIYEEDPGPQLPTIFLQLVFLNRTPDPSCFQSLHLYLWRGPRTPDAFNLYTFLNLSLCRGPQTQTARNNYTFVLLYLWRGPRTATASNFFTTCIF